ncbi:MAG: AAA family ATPase [Campylobacterales bacterium]|nr:AAA family ATPase [Campylobacterales bacterium]
MLNALASSQLYHACDSTFFSFNSTDEIEPAEQPIGQENALEAMGFATDIQQEGYNLFAMGPSGSGKYSTVMSFLKKKASTEETAKEWCYVNNFKDHHKPLAIDFESGQAIIFKNDIDELIELFKAILPTFFESSDYHNDRELINKKYLNKQAEIFAQLQEEARKHDVSMNTASPSRVTFVPIVDGKPITAEEFKTIEGEKKEGLSRKMSEFEQIVKVALRKVSELSKAMQKEFKAQDRRVTKEAVESLIDDLRQKYSYSPKITGYINAMQNDIIHHVQDFLVKPEEMAAVPFMQEFYTPSFARYSVNLLISYEEDGPAPVVFEDNPIYQNLIGRVEHVAHVGTLVTDFTMIKPGALHKANGGYLVLDARKLLMQPFSYEALKRVLKSKEVRIESLAQQYSLISTTTIEPEPIPLNLKVVLIGERFLYYLLNHYDPEFSELFKVTADFEDEMPRSDENLQRYAQMIGMLAKEHALLPLTPEAVARVIEQSSREVSHASKFSTHLRNLADLLKEADYWSKKNERERIEKSDIEAVLQSRKKRLNRIQLKLYEQVDEGTLMINVSGAAVGVINALTVISLGGYSFGLPSRITARTRIGKGEIIDIERKVELGGPIHSKGVMILSSYLGSRYASDLPLSLSASLVFEQSYGKIEGDSASSTELFALLSSLSQIPIKQNIAVTGSVNQFGEIQPIGGVNEKIEGFYDICMQKDPEAAYGVIIPSANVKHLMLKKEVLESVEKGIFSVYAITSIDEGISILTGIEAGEADEKGNYPEASLNAKVVARLHELSETAKRFSHTKHNDNNNKEEQKEP